MSGPAKGHSNLPILKVGSSGDDVLWVQKSLNEALKKQYHHINESGVYDQATKEAVFFFQLHFRLKGIDGEVGDETRAALATRVVVITGTIGRNYLYQHQPRAPHFGVGKLHLDPNLFITNGDQVTPRLFIPGSGSGAGSSSGTGTGTGSSSAPAKSHWLVQAQPQQQVTLPPIVFSDPAHGPAPGAVSSGVVSLGFVYRTAADGPHGEFGLAKQFLFNSQSTPTDPKYTLELVANATFADPWAKGRFHSALFLQAAGLLNLSPNTGALQITPGAQLSVDIIDDRWNVFVQGTLTNQWNLTNGQYALQPGFILGSTIQWEIGGKKH